MKTNNRRPKAFATFSSFSSFALVSAFSSFTTFSSLSVTLAVFAFVAGQGRQVELEHLVFRCGPVRLSRDVRTHSRHHCGGKYDHDFNFFIVQ